MGLEFLMFGKQSRHRIMHLYHCQDVSDPENGVFSDSMHTQIHMYHFCHWRRKTAPATMNCLWCVGVGLHLLFAVYSYPLLSGLPGIPATHTLYDWYIQTFYVQATSGWGTSHCHHSLYPCLDMDKSTFHFYLLLAELPSKISPSPFLCQVKTKSCLCWAGLDDPLTSMRLLDQPPCLFLSLPFGLHFWRWN